MQIPCSFLIVIVQFLDSDSTKIRLVRFRLALIFSTFFCTKWGLPVDGGQLLGIMRCIVCNLEQHKKQVIWELSSIFVYKRTLLWLHYFFFFGGLIILIIRRSLGIWEKNDCVLLPNLYYITNSKLQFFDFKWSNVKHYLSTYTSVY